MPRTQQNSAVSFKACLFDAEGHQIEVRRFGIDQDAATDYSLLQEKLEAFFPKLKTSNFKVSWKDADGDDVTISSGEELLEAFTQGDVCKLHITLLPPGVDEEGNGTPNTGAAGATKGVNQKLHSNIVCDNCDGEIEGSRYKCLQCEDYDLCRNCESTGVHADHAMLRFNQPILRRKARRFHKFCNMSRHILRNLNDPNQPATDEQACGNLRGQPFDMTKFKELLENLLSPLDFDLLLCEDGESEPRVLISSANAAAGVSQETTSKSTTENNKVVVENDIPAASITGTLGSEQSAPASQGSSAPTSVESANSGNEATMQSTGTQSRPQAQVDPKETATNIEFHQKGQGNVRVFQVSSNAPMHLLSANVPMHQQSTNVPMSSGSIVPISVTVSTSPSGMCRQGPNNVICRTFAPQPSPQVSQHTTTETEFASRMQAPQIPPPVATPNFGSHRNSFTIKVPSSKCVTNAVYPPSTVHHPSQPSGGFPMFGSSHPPPVFRAPYDSAAHQYGVINNGLGNGYPNWANTFNPFVQQAVPPVPTSTAVINPAATPQIPGNLPPPLIPTPAPVPYRQAERPQPRSTATQLTPEDRSEALLWHSVDRMIEMGFSNDDGRLFHVLQLVEGNIDRAIERLFNPNFF